MSISLGHGDAGVTKQFADFKERCAIHHQPALVQRPQKWNDRSEIANPLYYVECVFFEPSTDKDQWQCGTARR